MSYLPESTEKYYQDKILLISEKIKNKINSNIDYYQAFINVPFAKSMIRFKFNFDLSVEENKMMNGFTNSFNDDDMIDMIVDEGLNALISSTIKKIEPNKSRDIYLADGLIDSSVNEIKYYLDYALNLKFNNDIEKQLNSVKYLYFGVKHIRYILKIINTNKIEGYCGNYKNIKFFYIETIEDIYLSSSSFIDLNTTDIRYNEYIKEEYSDLFDIDVLYENVPNLIKKGVLTLNCYLGDINLIKLNCNFGEGVTFYRKLKLSRILKNEIEI